MIYENCNKEAPIRQGDIFRAIPRLDVSLESLGVIDEAGMQQSSTWETQCPVEDQKALTVLTTATPVDAVVITQDCDSVRRTYIALCEIVSMGSLVKSLPPSARKRADKIVRLPQENPRVFYLPPDIRVAGFQERMVVDFSVILRLNREDLEGLRVRRRCRLAEEAYQHFRETLAQYLRRYPVDVWYPLDADEFAAYEAENPGVEPREWQIAGGRPTDGQAK